MPPRPCFFPGCQKYHQGRGVEQASGQLAFFCGQHGGGYRCEYPDCTKLQQDMQNRLCRKHYKLRMGILPAKRPVKLKPKRRRVALANRTNTAAGLRLQQDHVQPVMVAPPATLQSAQPSAQTHQQGDVDDDVAQFMDTLGLDKDDMFAVNVINGTAALQP